MKSNVGGKDMEEEKLIESSLSLSEMIRAVQNELVASQQEREARGQAALLEFEKVDLEVNFVVTKESEAQGGVSFQVLTFGGFNLGGRKSRADQVVHKITLSLKAAAGAEGPPGGVVFEPDFPPGVV